MNWTKTIRMTAIAAGMMTSLFLTTSVRAQEITNSTFDDSRNMTAMPQPAVNPAQTQAAAEPAPSTEAVAAPLVQAGIDTTMLEMEAWTIVGLAGFATVVVLAGRKRMKQQAYPWQAASNSL